MPETGTVTIYSAVSKGQQRVAWKSHNLSQDEFAKQLLVTRQAVSRWENGDTIPNIDTLKLIAKTFDVSVDYLLGTSARQCQSCGMLDQDFDKGTSIISSKGFDKWFDEYQKKSELLKFALSHYNNGRMKRYLCELFINNDLENIQLIMDKASNLTGSRKEISKKFKELVATIL